MVATFGCLSFKIALRGRSGGTECCSLAVRRFCFSSVPSSFGLSPSATNESALGSAGWLSLLGTGSEVERDLANKRAALKRGLPYATAIERSDMGSEISTAMKRVEDLRQRRANLQAKLGLCNKEIAAIAKELKDLQTDVAERQASGGCVKFVQKRGVEKIESTFQRTPSNTTTFQRTTSNDKMESTFQRTASNTSK